MLLYELLTGSTPFADDELRAAAVERIKQLIREVDPPKPSTRLSMSAGTLPSLAAQRGVEPKRLGLIVRGELDWIVMKALEKDRKRRYDTASAMAADLNRHLSGEPVEAAPPSWGYRARKFGKKHKKGLLAAAALAALLFAGFATTTWQWRHAQRNAAAANAERLEADKQRDAAELEAYIANLALAQAAMDNDNWEEARERLTACPESKRGWEWDYLTALTQTVIFTVSPPDSSSSWPLNVEAASDGSATVTSDGRQAKVWDRYGKPIGKPVLSPSSSTYFHICDISPGGRHLIIVGSDLPSITPPALWDVITGTHISLNIGDWSPGLPGNFSNDGRLLVRMADSPYFAIVDSTAGCGTGIVIPAEDDYTWARFSPDGRTILTRSRKGMIRLWNGHDGTSLGSVESTDAQLSGVSPSGNVFATHSITEEQINIRDLRTGEPIGPSIPGRMRWNHSVDWSFNHDGSRCLINNRYTNQTVIYDIRTNTAVGEWSVPEAGNLSATFNLDSQTIVTGSYQGEAIAWQPDGRPIGRWSLPAIACIVPAPRNDEALCRPIFVFDPDSADSVRGPFRTKVAFVNADRFDTPNDLIQDVNDPMWEVSGLAALSTASQATQPATVAGLGTSELTIRVGGRTDLRLKRTTGVFTAVTVSPDATRAATISAGSGVQFHDLSTGRPLVELKANGTPTALRWMPDGKRLAITLLDGATEIWDIRPYEQRQADRDRVFAERQPAREHVRELLASDISTDKLADTVKADASLSELRRLVVLEELEWEVTQLRSETKSYLEEFTKTEWRLDRLEAKAELIPDKRLRADILSSVRAFKPGRFGYYTIADRIAWTKGLPREEYEFGLLTLSKETEINRISWLRTCAVLEYRLNRYESAIDRVNQSPAMFEGDNRAELAIRALCLHQLGRVQEADEEVSKIRGSRLEPDHELMKLLEEAIALIDPASTQPTTQPSTRPSTTQPIP